MCGWGGSSIDTASAMGRMFFTMAAAFTEIERNLTSERTDAPLSHKKAANEVYCNLTPLGFDREGDRLIENPAQMKIVERIHALRSKGQSLQRIATTLNKANAQTKRGGKWHPVTVQNILRIHNNG
jgi:site-specific DNA recombinase